MMKTELSALLDGELEGDRPQVVLQGLRGDADLRATWCQYHLIGDALRHAPHLEVDLTARIMTDLQREPAILSPSRKERKAPLQGLLRYAAAVAGVGAVAWLALSEPATLPMVAQPLLAKNALDRSSQPRMVQGFAQHVNAGTEANRLQTYLLAHQTYSPGNRFDGGAGYIRTVAAAR
ncbi:MAG: sigma-E factor negative regulatory protein [Sterolibacterium sp.]|nr:sigma-E factor negative regulatory protein [Sterolibacterium sp.]